MQISSEEFEVIKHVVGVILLVAGVMMVVAGIGRKLGNRHTDTD